MRIGVGKNKKKIFVNISKKNIELHPLWLRERVGNFNLLDINTGQRLYDTSNLNHDLKIKKALIKKKKLNVKFTDGLESEYFIKDLLDEINKNFFNKKIFLWNSKIVKKPVFKFNKEMFNNKEGYYFLENFYKFGFAIVKKTPDKKNFIIKFANSLGVVRPTNFGKLFNVKTSKKACDLAYTPLPLAAHTDNPYRKPIPGIQILHCIKNDSIGGESTLTDGFAVAEYLRKNFKNYFQILSKIKIRFNYTNKNTVLENWGETIELDKNNTIKKIRLSPRLDYVPILDKKDLNKFYKARSFFIKLCNSKKFVIKFKLNPGDLLIMDNYRILHGRTSYSMKIGERYLQGCYIDHDSTESKLNILKKKFNIQ